MVTSRIQWEVNDNADHSKPQPGAQGAAANARSPPWPLYEAELRHILSTVLSGEEKRETNLAEAIRRRFLPFGGIDRLEPHPPVSIGDPPVLDP
jgi:plasmid stability protein